MRSCSISAKSPLSSQPAANRCFARRRADCILCRPRPQDRNEAIGPNRPFLDLARGLAAEGIAVLRDRTGYCGATLLPKIQLELYPALNHFGIAGSPPTTGIRVLKVYDACNQRSAIQFLNEVRQRLPFRIHVVQTDNGAEFQSQFHWLAEALEIKHVYIRPRTPRLNVAGRSDLLKQPLRRRKRFQPCGNDPVVS